MKEPLPNLRPSIILSTGILPMAMYAAMLRMVTPTRSAVRSPRVSLAPYTMYDWPEMRSVMPSMISQMPPKLRDTRNRTAVNPPLPPKEACGGSLLCIRPRTMKTIPDTMIEDRMWVRSPHQLMLRYIPEHSEST